MSLVLYECMNSEVTFFSVCDAWHAVCAVVSGGAVSFNFEQVYPSWRQLESPRRFDCGRVSIALKNR
jgi:hypothetical protein